MKRFIPITLAIILAVSLAITLVPSPAQAQEPVIWTDPDLFEPLPILHTLDSPFLADKVSLSIYCSEQSEFYVILYNEKGEFVHDFWFNSLESGIVEWEEYLPGELIGEFEITQIDGYYAELLDFSLYSPLVWSEPDLNEPLPIFHTLDSPVLANKVSLSILCFDPSEFYVILYNEKGESVHNFWFNSLESGIVEWEEYLPDDYIIDSYEIMPINTYSGILFEFGLYYFTLPVHIQSIGTNEVQNGDTIEIYTIWNKPGYSIMAYFWEIDSGFDPDDITVIDYGYGWYTITYTVTEGNTRENGNYPVLIVATNSQGYYTIIFEGLFIVLDNPPAPVNNPPTAADDTATTDEDTSVTIDVLANDTDPDGDELVVSVVTQSASGSVAINADDSVTYTPDADFNGLDFFTYTASDGNGGTDIATVTITINPVDDTVPLIVCDGDDDDWYWQVVYSDPITIFLTMVDYEGNSIQILEDEPMVVYLEYWNGFDWIEIYPLLVESGALYFPFQVKELENMDVCSGDYPVRFRFDGNSLYEPFVQLGDLSVLKETSLITDADHEPDTWQWETVYSDLITINVNLKDDDGKNLYHQFDYPKTVYLEYYDGASWLELSQDILEDIYSNDNSLEYSFVVGLHSGDWPIRFRFDGDCRYENTVQPGTLTVINQAPIAVDDEVTLDEDSGKLKIYVLTNDYDPDGDNLTIVKLERKGEQPGQPLIDIVGDHVVLEPTLNWNGVDIFYYYVNDGNGGQSVAKVTVTINPVNDAPAAYDQEVTTDEDTPVAITLDASDVDSTTLSWEVINPSHGTLTGIAPNLTYTPDADYNGSDSFTFKVNDGEFDSNIATVSITVTAVNDPPVVEDDEVTLDEDSGTLEIYVLTNDYDPDGDSLALVELERKGEQPGQPLISIVGDHVVLEPTLNWNGVDIFYYYVNDGNGGQSVAKVTVTINPVNDAPSFTWGGNQTVLEDEGAQSVAWATMISAGPNNESSQVLDFIVNNDNNELFSAQPAIAADGTLTFTPAPNANGSATVTVQLHDDGGTDNGGQDTSPPLYFTITVVPVNDPPVAICTDTTLYLDENGQALLAPEDIDGGSYDPDGDPISLSLDKTEFTCAELDDNTIVLTVSDGELTGTCTATVTVVDNTSPVITLIGDAIVNIECGSTYTDTGVTAFDVCCGDMTGFIVITNPVNTSILGTYEITYDVTDCHGNNAAQVTRTVNVLDTTPPELSISVNPDTLWPPNHKMVEVNITATVSDIGDSSPQIILLSVTSNEPDNAEGDGNTDNDIQDAEIGTEDYTIMLRAERAGNGDDRIYTITYQATDDSGNSAIASISVIVPHDQGKKGKK